MFESKLKVNIKSLASEARHIRKESSRVKRDSELKGNDPEFAALDGHRRWNVRNEARAAQLLYAYLRGVPYSRVETNPDHSSLSWSDTIVRVKRKANRHKIPIDLIGVWLTQATIDV